MLANQKVNSYISIEYFNLFRKRMNSSNDKNNFCSRITRKSKMQQMPLIKLLVPIKVQDCFFSNHLSRKQSSYSDVADGYIKISSSFNILATAEKTDLSK